MPEQTLSIYVTAVTIGAIHGIEPGHGWPVAAVFALRKRNRWTFGLAAAVIIAVAHLISSFAVVAVYAVADSVWQFGEFDWLHYVSGALLIAMGAWQWLRGGHGHHGHHHGRADNSGAYSGLWAIAMFAFVLGFAHEEEFAIIALSAGKASAWGVMAIYALAVSASLVALTLVSIATFNRLAGRMHGVEHALPRVSAAVLIVMGVAYLFEWI
jgi:cytochrome c biogenesis protein CcdA